MTRMRSRAQELVAQCIAECLGRTEPIALDTRFRDLGVDSLHAVRIAETLSQRADRPLHATALWAHPTVRALARFVETGATDQVQSDAQAGVSQEPIAVIGMGCRLPGGVDSASALWRALKEGANAITETPPSRWNLDNVLDGDPTAPGKLNTRFGSYLDDVAGFDASFFGISPKEATQMDPQQRLALETAWEALEDGGVLPRRLQGSRTSVFFGAWGQDYASLGLDPSSIAQHSAVGWNTSIIPARIAYALGLRGPVMTVNTACSSSLVAVHLARQSLLQGECDLALVGGSNLTLTPSVTIQMTKFGGLSPKGQCRAFDAAADGYVRGEGCAVVVLRRLSDALEQGDRIYAVLAGSAVNSDGASNGLTAPNPAAQREVLERAWQGTGVRTAAVSFVEAHGTGTLLGDPIEAQALGEVFGEERETPLLVGSIKTNFGHLESAAGVAGLLKACLALHHGQLPQSLNFETPNPHIPFDELGLRVISRRQNLPDVDLRYGGVSSFGYGGTNAHVALAEAPFERRVLLPLAGTSGADLRATAQQLQERLDQVAGDEALLRLMPPQGEGPFRARVRGRHPDSLRRALGELGEARQTRQRARLVFVFSGHGSQWLGMARDLLTSEPTFGRAFARCSAAVEACAGWSPRRRRG